MFKHYQILILINFIIASIFTLKESTSYARSGYPTFFIDINAGLLTYKSKFVNSNDTSISTQYNFGAYAGSQNQLGVIIKTSTNTTAFSLNSSTITTTFQDSVFHYRWKMLYGGLILSQSTLAVSREADTDLAALEVDAIGTGYGFNAGLKLPIGRSSIVFFDASSISTSVIKEVNQEDISLGSRTEINLGSIIPITKSMFNGQIGYTQRSYSITHSGTSYAEVQTMTWFGFSTAFFF